MDIISLGNRLILSVLQHVPGFGAHQSTWWSTIDMGDSWEPAGGRYMWDSFRGFGIRDSRGMRCRRRYMSGTTRATSGTWLYIKTSPGHWLARKVRDFFSWEGTHPSCSCCWSWSWRLSRRCRYKAEPSRQVFRLLRQMFSRLATKLQQMATAAHRASLPSLTLPSWRGGGGKRRPCALCCVSQL